MNDWSCVDAHPPHRPRGRGGERRGRGSGQRPRTPCPQTAPQEATGGRTGAEGQKHPTGEERRKGRENAPQRATPEGGQTPPRQPAEGD